MMSQDRLSRADRPPRASRPRDPPSKGYRLDELLQIITTAVAKPGAAIVAPDPSFVMYRLYAVYANARYVAVPLQDNFDLDHRRFLCGRHRELRSQS